nr:helix-turn-helix domain-containing protein [Lachnospiraceae bacterium]
MKPEAFVEKMIKTEEYINIGNTLSGDPNDLMPNAGQNCQVMQKALFGIHQSDIVYMRHCNDLDIPLHSHDFIEVQYVSMGTIREEINGENLVLHEGSILVFGKGTTHRVFKAQTTTCMDYILLNERVFNDQMLRMLGEDNAVFSFVKGNLKDEKDNGYLITQYVDRKTANVLLELYDEARSSLIRNRRLEYLLLNEFFIRLDRLLKTPESNSRQSFSRQKMTHTITTYIANNYRDPSLKELADELHLNQNYLCRVIKELTGKTFTELVADLRLDTVKTMLLHSDMPIESIADMVGYSNPAFLYTVFRRKFGVTPSSYRSSTLTEMPAENN